MRPVLQNDRIVMVFAKVRKKVNGEVCETQLACECSGISYVEKRLSLCVRAYVILI